MATTLTFTAFPQEVWHDRSVPLDGQTLQTFAQQNDFTYAQESPYDSKALGAVATWGLLVAQHSIAGALHGMPFQFFQRFGVKANGSAPSTYGRTTMAAITLPYNCPDIVVASQLATSALTDSGIERSDNYPAQRIMTNDALIDSCISVYAPAADHATVQHFLEASQLAETIVRHAPFCNVRVSGNICIVYIRSEEYITPSHHQSSAALYAYGLKAVEAITGALAKGFQATNLEVPVSQDHHLRIDWKPDWKLFGWSLLGAFVLVAIVVYLIMIQATAVGWLTFAGSVLALLIVYFMVGTKSATTKEAQLLGQLRQRYPDITLLP